MNKKNCIGYYDSSEIDIDANDWEYDEMATQCEEAITDFLKTLNDNVFFCWIKDFGWRNLSGNKIFKANNGAEILSNILPNTQCTYYVYTNEGKDYLMRIVNYHHDSPTGETYYIRYATKEEKESI